MIFTYEVWQRQELTIVDLLMTMLGGVNPSVGFGIILGFVLDEAIHSLIKSLPLAENI